MAKAAFWTVTDTEARKPGERTGLDTPVVLAVNERLLWHGCSNILERANNLVSLTRSNWF